ncbi:m-AAA protease-interacting protein 1, mitochondrial [Pimephales promelas]|uniref:m-AAA protease-interacting protein 1, mitochondrial n=1 Tax=Pimephales promelas TaxID=90988 RepID=UPI0019556846|nr:m-AAA protease-interacting protein 1, mitochondrial [Pimephales promelas]KAG1942950.1 m-AAA protease-interacting protein 1, mitochondrial [Pimephales promelas]
MLRLTGLAARPLACSWKRNPLSTKQHDTYCKPWWHQRARTHASCAVSPERAWHHLRRPSAQCRHYSKDAGRDSEDREHPGITVVGSPDPITWIRNKCILFLIELYFGLKFSVDFDNGVKQAVVHVSTLLSTGRFEELRTVMSREAIERVRKKCKSLSEAQKTHLAISLDDMIFLLPEDVSIFFDQTGRKFVYITMRLWYLSSADVPEDPESTRIFKMELTEEDGPQKKIITAVYEFHLELNAGADPDWTVTRIWHWKQLE